METKPPRSFWHEVPCGHPPDPMAWDGPDGPVCHCGWILDPANSLPVSVPNVAVVPCDNCGCRVGIVVHNETTPTSGNAR